MWCNWRFMGLKVSFFYFGLKVRHVDMTKNCWTARSWATEIKSWHYLAMASMKIQISQSPSFFPKWRSFNPWNRSLKNTQKGHSGRTISSFFPLKPFNVGLPSLKVHPPFFSHQKINWKWGWKRQFGRVSNLKMWSMGTSDGQPLPVDFEKVS